ncbi:MAG: hypothetical protein FJ240_12585 [Nitrospira sp.]|nr:hypothetical protein [Nitrospira sp.]
MEWDFTPEDIRSGKADYSVLEFKEDLLDEIHVNLEEFRGNEETKKFYSFLTVMLCTSLAFGKSIDSFVISVKKYFPSKELQKFLSGDRELLEEIKENNKENIEMLRAVIHRRIEDDVDKGVPKDNIAKTITTELLTF